MLNLPITYRDFRAYTYQGVNNYATYTPVTGTGRGFFTKDEIDHLAPECFSNTVYRKRNFPGVGRAMDAIRGTVARTSFIRNSMNMAVRFSVRLPK